MDRVLAGPGSKVAWKEAELWIDGKRSDLRPLNGAPLPDQAELQVPAGMYYIVPSTNPVLPRIYNTAQGPSLFLHSLRSMSGKAIVRHYPIWRWWWMQ